MSTSLPLFYPHSDHAQSIDLDIRQSLLDSMRQINRVYGENCHWADISQSERVLAYTPYHFALYFRLLSVLVELEESADGSSQEATLLSELRHLQHLFAQAPLREGVNQTVDRVAYNCPEIVTLDDQVFGQGACEYLTSWLDMETENQLALRALSSDNLKQGVDLLSQALAFIQTALPDFYAEICALVQVVILAEQGEELKLELQGAHSFATWGAILIRYQDAPSWYELVPILIHETAHAYLFGLARDMPLVLNPPDALYSSPIRQQLRPMDGIFHAAFVSAREYIGQRELLTKVDWSGREDIEAYFRESSSFSFSMYQDCLAAIKQDALLSELGLSVLADVELYLDKVNTNK